MEKSLRQSQCLDGYQLGSQILLTASFVYFNFLNSAGGILKEKKKKAEQAACGPWAVVYPCLM